MMSIRRRSWRPSANQTVNEGQLLQFNATATDPGSPTTFTFSLANGASGQVPTGATIAAGIGPVHLDADRSARARSYTFDVVVTDSGTPALSDRETITVTVGEVNQARPWCDSESNCHGRTTPDLHGGGHRSGHPGQRLDLQLRGWSQRARNHRFDDGVFSWTPTNAQLGLQSVTVRVTDSDSPSLFAQHVVSITVNALANQAPVLAPIGNRSVPEGSQIVFTASATIRIFPRNN